MGEETTRRKLEVLTVFVGVEEVRRQLGCRESLAYEHLRAAAGRRPGERGLLRVSSVVWERYILHELNMSNSTIRTRPQPARFDDRPTRRAHTMPAAGGPGMPRIPTTNRISLTQPRTKRRGGEEV